MFTRLPKFGILITKKFKFANYNIFTPNLFFAGSKNIFKFCSDAQSSISNNTKKNSENKSNEITIDIKEKALGKLNKLYNYKLFILYYKNYNIIQTNNIKIIILL